MKIPPTLSSNLVNTVGTAAGASATTFVTTLGSLGPTTATAVVTAVVGVATSVITRRTNRIADSKTEYLVNGPNMGNSETMARSLQRAYDANGFKEAVNPEEVKASLVATDAVWRETYALDAKEGTVVNAHVTRRGVIVEQRSPDEAGEGEKIEYLIGPRPTVMKRIRDSFDKPDPQADAQK